MELHPYSVRSPQ
jgi:hypothetical protein